VSALAVTVRTDYVALADLFLQLAKRNPPVAVQLRDVTQLVLAFSVIEVHYIVRITLSAIRTGLVLGIAEYVANFAMKSIRPCHILSFVLTIILPEVFRYTRAAIALPPLPLRSELGQCLHGMTPATPSRGVLVHRSG
jgi:hypothetical protein